MRNLQQRFVAMGLADAETLERMAAAWHAWSNDPDAFFAKAWCEAIGWVD